MEPEELLVHTAQAWAAEMLPDDPHAAAAAVEAAIYALAGGASISEACREIRTLLCSWALHPSHRQIPAGRPKELVAS
jgi:hypothetical protein